MIINNNNNNNNNDNNKKCAGVNITTCVRQASCNELATSAVSNHYTPSQQLVAEFAVLVDLDAYRLVANLFKPS